MAVKEKIRIRLKSYDASLIDSAAEKIVEKLFRGYCDFEKSVERYREVRRELLEAVTAAARDGGTDVLFLEVRAGNERARNLYKSAGFRETGRRKAYYRRPVEDAVLMELRLV